MTIATSFALLLIMAALAAIPSSSVLLVVTRSATIDIKNGLATAFGVVSGDLIFMTMAILGMTALAEQMGTLFVVIKYIAGAYLIWFGIGLIRSQRNQTKISNPNKAPKKTKSSLAASFGAGLILTLGDIKAIFFYASLLPSFLDLATLTAMDVFIVSAITIIAVGGVKAAYAFGAGKASGLAKGFSYERELKMTSGGLMVGAGTYLLLRD
ncbi:MAG: LysE family translocator [Hyphomicrobiales bacterium]